jgi:hypothetical protein
MSETAERLRRIRRENPGWSTEKNVRWQAANPEKRAAHKVVENAIRAGRLARNACERCGTDAQVHAHHDDYSRPLDVRWLCPVHHRDRHRELREMAVVS